MAAGRTVLGVEYRLLGRTGLRVSPLCLGTMNFGGQAEEAEGHRIMDRALELGINFFDTANVYGAPGLPTEEIIGRWLIQGDRRRERTVIATKVYGGRDSWPNTSRLSARHIRESCERSLRRMQTDYIDLYQMHHVDRDTPWEEIWQAMELLVQQGKVLYVGSSNFAGWHIVKANERAARRDFLGLVSEQSLYNLNARMVELEVLLRASTTASVSFRGARSGAASSGAPCRSSPRGAAAPRGCSSRSSACDRRWKHGRSCVPTTAATRQRRAGVVAAQPGSDGADHRPAHRRATRWGHRRTRRAPRRRDDHRTRPHLPGPRWRRSRGLCLVTLLFGVEPSPGDSSAPGLPDYRFAMRLAGKKLDDVLCVGCEQVMIAHEHRVRAWPDPRREALLEHTDCQADDRVGEPAPR